MEETDVEIIESTNNWERDVPKLVGIKESVDNSHQTIINGVVQQQKVFLVHCPKCGRVVYTLDEVGTTRKIALDVCTQNKEQLLEVARYCPKCGQRLSYDFGEYIDNETEENK